MKEQNCSQCKFQSVYQRKPGSMLGRLWKWHTRWCPGWKKYISSLPTEEKLSQLQKLHMNT